MDVQTLKNWVGRGLALLGFAAGFTPTKVDDQIIGFLKVAAENEEVMQFLVLLVNQFNAKKVADSGHKVTMEDVVAILKVKGHV